MNRNKFQRALQGLGAWRERAFILALAERALPNAVLYLEGVNHPALSEKDLPEGLYSLLDQIWRDLIESPDEERIVTLLDRLVMFQPEQSASEHYGVLPTQDCLDLLEQALLAGLNDEKKRALELSQRSLETVTQFIEFSEGEGLSENALVKLFDSHPLVERELSFQSELLDLLRHATHPGTKEIAALRDLARDEGVSNLGISLG